jgi:hypothetical protein
MDRNSDAILRHLEASPDDLQARNALHDALMEEQRDPVLAAGVHWLWVNHRWPAATTGANMGPDQKFVIYLADSDWGISRMPFTGAVHGPTVAATLRVFSAYLWDCRQLLEALFGDAPFQAPRRSGAPAVSLQEALEEAVRRVGRDAPMRSPPWVGPPWVGPTWVPDDFHTSGDLIPWRTVTRPNSDE